MSLLELLLASGLFLGSTAASLTVWGRVSVVLSEDRDRLGSLDALDAEMQAAEARLRDPALGLGSALLSCPEQLRRLAGALQAQPAQPGVERQVLLPVGPGPLELKLRAGSQERLRVYSPEAFGGCGAGRAAVAGGPGGVAGDTTSSVGAGGRVDGAF
jgi:hypothetical protein